MERRGLLAELRALIRSGDEPEAARRLRQALLIEDDPVLRYLLGEVLVRMGKEVEGWFERELALERLEAVEGGLELARRELDELLSTDEDEPRSGADA